MKTYELTFILRVDEDSFIKGKKYIEAEFKKQSVKILKETDMGIRELAYEIKKEKKGHYYFYEFEVLAEKILAMDKYFKLESSFLKYLVVNKEN